MSDTYISERERREFIDGYTEALLWSTPISGAEGCEEYAYDEDYDVAPTSLAAIERCALTFLTDNARALDLAARDGRPWSYLGHDAHLTREGHGVGFWAREELRKPLRDYLTARCEADRTAACVWTEEIDGEIVAFVEGIE
jgi:hypothetical protein